MRLLAVLQGQQDEGSKHFELIQIIKAATAVQLKTLRKKDFGTASERSQGDRISVQSKGQGFERNAWQFVFYYIF